MALAEAAKAGNLLRCEELLKDGADVNAAGEDGEVPLVKAVHGGDFMVLRRLARAGAKAPPNLLHIAAEKGNPVLCSIAIDECKIPIDNTDAEGCTPLVFAAKKGQIDVQIFLLERGANVNAADSEGNTALHTAAETGQVDMVKTLVLFGAKSAANKAGKTPEDLAPAGVKGAIAKEIAKGRPANADDMAARFKAQGNKVFAEGEYVKGAKFYGLAVAYTPSNHVFFSNRSACYFNQKRFDKGLADANRCIEISPKWPKGYFRKGSCLMSMGCLDEALEVIEAGLKLDSGNKDLTKAKEDIMKEKKKLDKKLAK